MILERAKVVVRGAVQGVGFRPHIYRLATGLHLSGWALNGAQGVLIEVEGPPQVLRQFLLLLETEKPPRAVIHSLESSFLDPAGFDGFEIRPSDDSGARTTLILPDIATCADCLRDITGPANRRYRYPFTNCTNCGPRFSIIEALPYDRPNTSMKRFAMCEDCEREYGDPRDRRFHAQPIACPKCGPQLEWWDAGGQRLSGGYDALLQAAAVLREGGIVALKGIGGFQLMVDARSDEAVARLRDRKHREEKPFALLFPALEAVREQCRVGDMEERLLLAPESPIVLLKRRSGAENQGHSKIAASVAPGNPTLGAMLPYTPLHHLLMAELAFPVVATSGNLSDEPICIDNDEALDRLGGIADFFLVHDRPIVRHVDDSIVRVVRGREMVLRRARGYAPLPVTFKPEIRNPHSEIILAVGAHLKNSIAMRVGDQVFISQHIGDLETREAFSAFQRVAADFPRLYGVRPDAVACDMHPEYLSTKHAALLGAPVIPVQHHWAHVLACMAENEIDPPVLGVSWDGTGYGPDGTIWGGEFLLAGQHSFRRVAHLRTFRLPGGEAAIKEPRRTALGILHAIWGDAVMQRDDLAPVRAFSGSELALIGQMLARRFNAPVTSSAGRLFDAVASIVDLRQRLSFEGQAAMELEFAAEPGAAGVYPFEIDGQEPAVVDWQPMIEGILMDLQRGEPAGVIAAKFHNTLAGMAVAVAHRIGEERVVLTGGCFQNCRLTEECLQRLSASGFRSYWHQRVPPNDGGIALGQVMAAAHALRAETAAEGAVVA